MTLPRPDARPRPRWAAWALVALGAAVAAGSAVLAVAAPSSWWGGTFAAGSLALLLAARPVVPAAYRGGWPRATVLVTALAAMAGGCYAFAVRPLGPRPGVAWPLGLVLLLAAFAPVASYVSTGGVGPLGRYGDAVRRAEREGRR